MLGDTWALKRRNGAFALDEKNHRFVVWGGTPIADSKRGER